MVYQAKEYTEREDRQRYPSAYEGIPPEKSKLDRLIELLNHKGVLSEAERIAVEA